MFTLQSIAVVVLGGTSLFGGSGGVDRDNCGRVRARLIIRSILFFARVNPLQQPLVGRHRDFAGGSGGRKPHFHRQKSSRHDAVEGYKHDNSNTAERLDSRCRAGSAVERENRNVVIAYLMIVRADHARHAVHHAEFLVTHISDRSSFGRRRFSASSPPDRWR